MANPLFYSDVAILDRVTHKDLRLSAASQRFAFARTAHVIPALAEEFAAASGSLAIAFIPGASRPSPVFVTGLAPGQNAFINDSGEWEADYVPAYLRRYPFIVGERDGEDPVLCIDESYEGFGTEEGERLFDEEGEPGPAVSQAITFAEQYRAAAARTEELCGLLQDFGLMRSVTLDARKPSGELTVVHGLMTVDEAALDALSDEQFLELRKGKFLGLIYSHLMSMRALERLNERSNAREADAA